MPLVGKILTGPHLTNQNWPVENIIAGRAPPNSPVSFDIRSGVVRPDPLAVAIDAAIGVVDSPAPLHHAGGGLGINIGAFLIRLRIEVADLPVRDRG